VHVEIHVVVTIGLTIYSEWVWFRMCLLYTHQGHIDHWKRACNSMWHFW